MNQRTQGQVPWAKWTFLIGLSIFFMILAFFFDSFSTILRGLLAIQLDPSVLTTDYLVVGGIGATLWNSALVILGQLFVLKLNRNYLPGTLVATVLLVGGFAFFGTNLLNSMPIILGTYLYAKLNREDFALFVMQAFLATTLGPLLSTLAFVLDISYFLSIPLAFVLGLFVGFIIPALSPATLRYHQGYTLYNIGFVAGIIGMVMVAVFRMFHFEINPVSRIFEESQWVLALILAVIFLFTMICGILLNDRKLVGYHKLLLNSGRLLADYDVLYGTGLTLFNIGTMGLVSILYVVVVRGSFNGPVIGGILSVAAFAAMGKHPRNALPVMLGVFLASWISPSLEPNSTPVIVTALFGTTLAPVAGEYGPLAGIVAGFLHAALVTQVLPAHGGVNLYNNGFASGFVAGTMVPLLEYLRQRKEKIYE